MEENRLLAKHGWVVKTADEKGCVYEQRGIELIFDTVIDITFDIDLSNACYGSRRVSFNLEEMQGINQVINELRFGDDAIKPIEREENNEQV